MALANVPASTPAGPVTPSGIVFPAAAALALKQGQVLEARVVQVLGGDAVRLNIQGILIDALAGAKLTQGALLQVRVEGEGPSVRLAILPEPIPQQAANSQAGPRQAPPPVAQPAGPSVEAALQRLLGDVVRSLTGPQGALSDSQRQAAARILNLAAPSSASSSPALSSSLPPSIPASLPASLPPGALAQLVSNLAQIVAQEPGGAGDLARQAAARLFGLSAPQASGTAQSSSAPPPAVSPGGALKALFASAELLLAGKPEGVPAPVRDALAQLVALRAPVNGTPDDGALQRAVAASGIFAEAHMAQGAVPQPAGDMKLALFFLRGAVRSWLGEDKGGSPQTGKQSAAPVRGAGQATPARMDPPLGAARDMARVLLAQSDAALARLRVAQVAALPDRADHGHATVTHDQNGSLHLLLPLANGNQPGFLQMQIDRDGGGDTAQGACGWRVRFALDVEPAGPAQAVVGLAAGTVSVSLWAERAETAAALSAQEPLLRDMLKQAGLEAGALALRRGKPPAQIWRGAKRLDRRS